MKCVAPFNLAHPVYSGYLNLRWAVNKKLSYRWQTARRLCTPMLTSPWHKTLRSKAAFHAVLLRAALSWMTAIYWRDFPTFTTPLPFDEPYRVHIWYGKARMAGLQSNEGRMMIDSVVWAQYINVTDTQTYSHVATANAAPTHCVRWQKHVIVRPTWSVSLCESKYSNNKINK